MGKVVLNDQIGTLLSQILKIFSMMVGINERKIFRGNNFKFRPRTQVTPF